MTENEDKKIPNSYQYQYTIPKQEAIMGEKVILVKKILEDPIMDLEKNTLIYEPREKMEEYGPNYVCEKCTKEVENGRVRDGLCIICRAEENQIKRFLKKNYSGLIKKQRIKKNLQNYQRLRDLFKEVSRKNEELKEKNKMLKNDNMELTIDIGKDKLEKREMECKLKKCMGIIKHFYDEYNKLFSDEDATDIEFLLLDYEDSVQKK